MVVRTRRVLRDKTRASNAAQQAGTSTSPLTAKAKKTAPLRRIQDLDEPLEVLNTAPDDSRIPLSNARTSSRRLPILQSTPIANKRRRPLIDLTKLSSPLPPSSPVPTSPVNHEDLGGSGGADPFGFLAVENKLKAQRVGAAEKATNSRKAYRVYDDSDIEDMYATDEEGGDLAPLAATTEEQPPILVSQGVPRTPSKRTGKGKLVESPASLLESSTVRFPSSPSPVKPRAAKAPLIKNKGVRGRPKRMVRTKETVQREENEEEEMDPSMMVKHLESLLPRRPAKRPVREVALRGTRKRKVEDIGDSESEEQRTKKKGKKPPVRSSRKKPASTNKRTKTKKAVDLGLSEEQEKARRERIEYFKRLDEYELAKENVYVV